MKFLVTTSKRTMKMIKGYFTDNGYYGYVNGGYVLFEGDEAYYEYEEETECQNTQNLNQDTKQRSMHSH